MFLATFIFIYLFPQLFLLLYALIIESTVNSNRKWLDKEMGNSKEQRSLAFPVAPFASSFLSRLLKLSSFAWMCCNSCCGPRTIYTNFFFFHHFHHFFCDLHWWIPNLILFQPSPPPAAMTTHLQPLTLHENIHSIIQLQMNKRAYIHNQCLYINTELNGG